jgi:hypothetical protein
MIGRAGGAAHPGGGEQPLRAGQRADVRFGAKAAESCRAPAGVLLALWLGRRWAAKQRGTMVKVDELWFGMRGVRVRLDLRARHARRSLAPPPFATSEYGR